MGIKFNQTAEKILVYNSHHIAFLRYSKHYHEINFYLKLYKCIYILHNIGYISSNTSPITLEMKTHIMLYHLLSILCAVITRTDPI